MPESKRGINDTVYVVMGVDPTDMTWIEAAFNDYDEARNLCAHMNTKYEYLGTSYWVSPIRVLRYALDHSEFPDPDPDA